jgi:hypothetical protein
MCGSRTWDDPRPIAWLVRALKATSVGAPHTVITGGARGADALAARSAGRLGVTLQEYPADWSTRGRAAGPLRNQRMLDDGAPDVVFAFTDDIATSRGTRDMCERAAAAGRPVYVVSRYTPDGSVRRRGETA